MPNELTGVLSGSSSIIRTQPLTATENGTYNPPSGVDGYKPVVVNVPQPQPVIEQLTATYNGIYNAPSGVDGYDPVVVNVPAPAPVLDDITITENGHYVPPTGVDGYDDITVNVPVPAPVLDDITITENGHYVPPTGVDGYDDITVNVPLPANAYLKQTLSGLPSPIATFTGADAPLDSLKASIEGVQDLHGYDSPWAGGAGKNKLAMNISDIKSLNTTGTWNGDTYTINGAEYKINIDTAGNITSINARSIASNPNGDLKITTTLLANSYILSSGFTETNGVNDTFLQKDGVTIARGNNSSPGSNFTITESSEVVLHIRLSRNDSSFICTPMIRLSTVSDATFAPYSNICPINGWSSCEVTVNNDTYTIPFKDSSDNPITVYDGGIDVTGGKLTVTHANIASYNGETINEPWISSEDVYTQGATPTTGAQVVYPLTTPLVYEFNPLALRSDGVTNISVDCGDITECKYFTQS